MKAYLLDTNVISEIMTTEPNQRVIDFLAQIKESYLSAITLLSCTMACSFCPKDNGATQ